MQSLRLSFVVACASLVACGDDATSASESSESSTGGPAESSGTMPADTSSSSEGGTSVSTTVVADTSTTVVDESSSSSSSTGEPNNPPIAVDDLYVMSMADTPLGITADLGVLANDSDPDGDAITVDDFDAMSTAGGTVAIDADGAFTYTPPAGFWGEDGFDYTITDDGGATASAHVRVVVAPTTVSLGEVTDGVGGFMIEGTAAGDQAGFAVAGGGDVNGDGRADAIIGAYTADVVGSSEGRVFVAYGKDDGTAVSAMDLVEGYGGFVIDGIADFDRTGYSVAHAGDVNGDGLADIVIGAPQANAVSDDEGMAFVVFGKTDQDPVPLATLEADGAGFVINGIAIDDLAGSAVGGGADVDGDGLDDVIVGAPQANGNAVSNSGRVFVVHGKADTTAVALGDVAMGTGGFVIEGIASEDHAGDAVAGAGDVNGDGLEDIIVGVPLANAGATNTGRAYVIFGRTATTAVQLSSVAGGTGGFAIDGTAALDQAGDAVAGAGDVDGDGLADVILGAPGAETGADLQGRSYVVLGKDDGTLVPCEDVAMGIGGFAIDGEAEGDLSGWSVGGGVDIDGDGLADVLVGAQNADFAALVAGRSYVVYGSTAPATVSLTNIALGMGGFAIDGEMATDVSGWSISGAGDMSGDGLGDALVGAYSAPGGDLVGRSYVVFGGDFFGRVAQLGTAGDDEILGSADVDTLLGGDGNDILHSLGNFDVIYGGPGDDAIVLTSAELFRIDGGAGIDAIVLDGSDLALDLPGFYETAFVGIEAVDLTGTGDNALFLEIRDLRALSKTSNTLLVLGDAGDQLVADFSGAGLVDLGSAMGFHTWSDGVLTLSVADEVEAFVQL